MQAFDLEQLRTLVAAVDAGSFSAAASVRNLSQSTMSEQLRKLEARAGQPLLIRGKAGVQATVAGERLLGHARRLLALSDEAWRDMHGVPLEGEVNLAITDYFRPADLARLLARLSSRYPRLRLRTHIGTSDDIETGWRKGGFDLAVVMNLPGRANARARVGRVLRTEPLAWVASAAMARPAAGPLPLVLLPETCSLHKLARASLQARQIPHVVAHVASGVAGLRAAVAAGLGIACLNVSSWGEHGLAAVQDPRLPPLPDADFVLLPPSGSDGRPQAMQQDLAEAVAQVLEV